MYLWYSKARPDSRSWDGRFGHAADARCRPPGTGTRTRRRSRSRPLGRTGPSCWTGARRTCGRTGGTAAPSRRTGRAAAAAAAAAATAVVLPPPVPRAPASHSGWTPPAPAPPPVRRTAVYARNGTVDGTDVGPRTGAVRWRNGRARERKPGNGSWTTDRTDTVAYRTVHGHETTEQMRRSLPSRATSRSRAAARRVKGPLAAHAQSRPSFLTWANRDPMRIILLLLCSYYYHDKQLCRRAGAKDNVRVTGKKSNRKSNWFDVSPWWSDIS